MSVFEGYTLRNRPEVTLTGDELWEVYSYCQGLNGLDALLCWLENEAPDDPEDVQTWAIKEYAKTHSEDVDLGYAIWTDYMNTCTYEMGYEEMCSVVRCLEEGL